MAHTNPACHDKISAHGVMVVIRYQNGKLWNWGGCLAKYARCIQYLSYICFLPLFQTHTHTLPLTHHVCERLRVSVCQAICLAYWAMTVCVCVCVWVCESKLKTICIRVSILKCLLVCVLLSVCVCVSVIVYVCVCVRRSNVWVWQLYKSRE